MYHSTECTEYDKQALAAYKSFDDCRLFTDGLTRWFFEKWSVSMYMRV